MAEEEKEQTRKSSAKKPGKPGRRAPESIWSSLGPAKGKPERAEEKEDEEKEEKSSFTLKSSPSTLAETLKDIEAAAKRKAERAREIKSKGSELRKSRLEEARERLAAGPPASVLKGNSGALKAALRRGQIKQISPRGGASPKSKDTESVFTVSGTRYAKTDLYKPTISDRATALKHRAGESATSWWDKHKTQVVIGAFGVAAAILAYNAVQNAQERSRLAALAARKGHRRSTHRSGILTEMPRGMMGGWYEMAPGAEEASARAQIEAMYPHFETSGDFETNGDFETSGEWSGMDPLALAQVVSPSDQGFGGWPDVQGFYDRSAIESQHYQHPYSYPWWT
jgi:hypothetical protein